MPDKPVSKPVARPVSKPVMSVRRRVALAAVIAVAVVPALVGAAPSAAVRAAQGVQVRTPGPPGPPFTVMVVDTDTQGRVLTDLKGQVLYHFDGDDPAGGVFGCTGACLSTRPPLLTTPGTPLHLPPGVPGTLAAVERPDGVGDQVTYDGAPLYTYTGDRPGDTNGVVPGWHAAQVTNTPPGPAPAAGLPLPSLLAQP